jgi:hypothetical protein
MKLWYVFGIGAIVAMTAQAYGQDPEPAPTPPEVPDMGYLKMIPEVAKWGAFAEHSDHVKWMQLRSEARSLAQKYAKSDKEGEKKELRKKLAEALSQQFDLHMEQQQKELEKLEKQISDLRALMEKRQEAKNAIVERRIEQLAQEAQGMGWQGTDIGHRWPFGDFTPPAPPTPPRAKKASKSKPEKE